MKYLDHPYCNLSGGQWLRGNLHSHTRGADKVRMRQEMVDTYNERGFDFLMMSEHDVFTGEAEYADLDSKGLVLIPGNEITARGPHMLHVNGDRFVEPSVNRQDVIDAVGDGPGFVVVSHPNWGETFDHCPIDSLREWSGYVGMEIYNAVIARRPGNPYAMDKWDMLLTEGRRVWGFASDDYHSPTDAGLGWNVVYSEDRTRDAILAAIRTGRFYTSSGVVISKIVVEDMGIHVETENASRIVASMQWGCSFAVADERAIKVEVPDRASYVRFTCWGEGEQFAWTQPFFVIDQVD